MPGPASAAYPPRWTIMTTPEQNGSQKGDFIPRGRIRRTMPLAGFTARAATARLVAGAREKAGDAGALERFHERTAEHYVDLLGHSKGALMKAGQFFSMIDVDALGNGGFARYQKVLSRLQTDAPPMTPTLLHAVLLTELQRPADELFATFDDAPMAAASIGQVHRALMHDGRDVVVKVQYPGVDEAIRGDLANAELLATFLRFLTAASGMKADVRTMAREATARLTEELDYRHEADMITRFSELYRDHPFIRIPEVVPELSGDRVLTMTHLDGIDWSAAQLADQDLKNTWAEVIHRFSYANYRHSNLMHADPHPGNYRFRADGTVGFVDFGCVRILPEHIRRGWIAMGRAAIEGRKNDLRAVMTELGFLDADPTLTADDLYHWFSQMLYEVLAPEQPVTYNQATTDRALRNLFDTRNHTGVLARLSVPEELTMTSRVIFAVNAISGSLNATLHARAAANDIDSVAEPVTEFGKAHHAWVRARGLPTALEPQ